MGINYASKYAQKIDEKFSREALTEQAVNKDYDFVGVKTVNVYSIPTAEMNDYSRTGDSRYGTPSELQNTVQELTLSMDRSFTFSIDRGNFDDTQMSSAAGAALQRQLREVVIPEIDKYRLGVMAAAATSDADEITSENAYDAFLDGTSAMINAMVPIEDCIAFVSNHFYKCIKTDSSFIRSGDLSQNMLVKGQVGMIDGIRIVVVPDSLMPDNTNFIIAAKSATVSPVKLSEYKIHDNPPGINGWLVEGRVYYDAFIMDNKKPGLYVHKIEDDTEEEPEGNPEGLDEDNEE